VLATVVGAAAGAWVGALVVAAGPQAASPKASSNTLKVVIRIYSSLGNA
jgi:hypothetical protein